MIHKADDVSARLPEKVPYGEVEGVRGGGRGADMEEVRGKKKRTKKDDTRKKAMMAICMANRKFMSRFLTPALARISIS